MHQTFGQLARALECLPARPVRLIAVDGGAGSGKTTFAALLGREMAVPVLQIDDFISWLNLESWWPRFEEHVLGPLFRGEDLEFQVRDWVGDTYGEGLGEWKRVPWNETMILEGIGSSRMALLDRLAYAIWVEAPEDLRIRRGIERDGETDEALWRRWMPFEADFFAQDGARSRASLFVDGTQPFEGGFWTLGEHAFRPKHPA